MQITLTWQTIITLASGIGALILLVTYLTKIVHWIDKMKDTEEELVSIRAELAILTMGLLAALKGLQEQGCNGPVTEGIKAIEDHINRKAHE